MIESSRLRFKLLEETHFPHLLAMYAEPDSNKYIRPLRNKTLEEYQEFFRFKLEQNQAELGFFWSVFDAEGSLIGTANFNHFAPFDIEHVGVHLSRRFWSQGYGTEIVETLLNYAHQAGRKEVHALVEHGHSASIRMLEKAGMRYLNQRENSGDTLLIYQKKWS